MNLNEIFGKSGTYDEIKSDKKQSFTWHSLQTVYLLKYILRVQAFFHEASILVFAESKIFHSM